MTVEYILLLFMFVFIVLGGFIRDGGPRRTFEESAPRLAARIERDLSTGTGFNSPDGLSGAVWEAPSSRIETGELK